MVQIVIVIMSLAFISFVTVLHIVGKVRLLLLPSMDCCMRHVLADQSHCVDPGRLESPHSVRVTMNGRGMIAVWVTIRLQQPASGCLGERTGITTHLLLTLSVTLSMCVELNSKLSVSPGLSCSCCSGASKYMLHLLQVSL